MELQIEKDEAAPDPDAGLSPKKKRLKRQIKEEALLRLEEAARTEDDFAAVQYHWDRRDSNRERKERLFLIFHLCPADSALPLRSVRILGSLLPPVSDGQR